MSQQHEMKFADLPMDTSETPYQGYRNQTYREEYPTAAYKAETASSRLTSKPDLLDSGVNPTFMMQMRLGLIIVLLLLWVIVFFGSIWAITKIPGSLSFILYPMTFLGLGIFTVLVVLSNMIFRRR